MISVTIDKRDANAHALAAFDRSECQELIGTLLARGIYTSGCTAIST